MTRAEFIENVTLWWELIDFCNDQGCDYCEDIYDDGQRDDYINEYLVEWARDDDWETLRDRLSNLETGYEYWLRDVYDEWTGLNDSDFENYKNDVLTWMDDNGYWDEDDDEEEEEVYEEELVNTEQEESDPEDEVPVEAEDFSFSELFSSCNSTIQVIGKAKEDAEAEAEAEFNEFIDGIVAVVEGRK